MNTQQTTQPTVAERVHAYLAEYAQADPAMLNDPTLRLDQIGELDSLGEADLLFQIEGDFDIVIDESIVLRDMTIGEAIACFQGLVDARAQAAAAD